MAAGGPPHPSHSWLCTSSESRCRGEQPALLQSLQSYCWGTSHLRVRPRSPFFPGAAPPAPLSKRHHYIFFFALCHRHFLFATTLAFFSPTLSSPSYHTPTRSRLFFSFRFFLSHSQTVIIPSTLYLPSSSSSLSFCAAQLAISTAPPRWEETNVSRIRATQKTNCFAPRSLGLCKHVARERLGLIL